MPAIVGAALLMATGCSKSTEPGLMKTEVSSTGEVGPDGEIMAATSVANWDAVPDAVVKRRDNDIVVLDLRNATIESFSPIFGNLPELPKLTELMLPGDAVDPASLRVLKKCPSLRRLRVVGGAFNDNDALGCIDLSDLQAVTWQDTLVTDVGVTAMANMNDLREVSLMGSPVTDACLSTLSKCKKLTKLRLRGTQITGLGFEPIAETMIEDLELSESEFGSEGMSAIGRMANLKRLNLWMTKVNDAGLVSLQGNQALTHLNLDNCPGISDVSLPVILSMKNLQFLHLGGTTISADLLTKLTELQNLETLIITRLSADQPIADELQSAMPKLKTVEF